MSEAFERHRDKRISEMLERIRNSKKRKIEMRTFGQRVEKAWKNINEKKTKLRDLSYTYLSLFILDLIKGEANEKNKKY